MTDLVKEYLSSKEGVKAFNENTAEFFRELHWRIMMQVASGEAEDETTEDSEE